MSGGIAVKTGKRWAGCGLERSDDTAAVFRPQQREGLGLDGMGAAGPKTNERGQRQNGAVIALLREGSSPDGGDGEGGSGSEATRARSPQEARQTSRSDLTRRAAFHPQAADSV